MPKMLSFYEYTWADSLPYYRTKLAETNPAVFKYMDATTKEAVRGRLITTLALLRVEAQEHMERERRKKLKVTCEEILSCTKLLAQLDESDETIYLLTHQDKPLRYLGLNAALDLQRLNQATLIDESEAQHSVQQLIQEANVFVSLIMQLEKAEQVKNEDEIEALRQKINFFNEARWVTWGASSSLFSAFFDEFSRETLHFSHEGQLKETMGDLAFPMGVLSGFTHFFRFFAVELRETIREARNQWQPLKGNKIYEEYSSYAPKLEEKTSAQRFLDDLSSRKFALLNSFLWGSVNTFCFAYKLVKGNSAAFAISALTLTVLIVDVALSLWRYLQLKNEYKSQEEAINKKIEDNETKLHQLREDLQKTEKMYSIAKKSDEREEEYDLKKDRDALINQIQYLQGSNNDLKESISSLKAKWHYQQYKIWNGLAQDVGAAVVGGCTLAFLLGGFAGITIVGVVGAVALFALKLLFNAINATVDYLELTASSNRRRSEAENHAREFNALLEIEPRTEETEQSLKYHFLQMKTLLARSGQDKALARFELKKAPVNTFLSALVPAVLFCSLVFLQIGWAILVIAAFLALVVAAQKLIKSWKPPQPDEHHFFPKFGEEKESELGNEFKARLEHNRPIDLDKIKLTAPSTPALKENKVEDVPLLPHEHKPAK